MKRQLFKTGITLLMVCGFAASPALSHSEAGNGGASRPTSSRQIATNEQAHREYIDGEMALKNRNFAIAEDDFREVLAVRSDGAAYFGLALALSAQNRPLEAIQTYEKLFHPDGHVSFGGSYFSRAHLEYALLLDQAGNWPEATENYQSGVSTSGSGNGPKLNVEFSPNIPQPMALAAATHIALGIDADSQLNNLGEYDHVRAFSEYSQALKLNPDWAVANYYYGYGLRQSGRRAEAQIAFQKAAQLDQKGDVKAAAEKAMSGR